MPLLPIFCSLVCLYLQFQSGSYLNLLLLTLHWRHNGRDSVSNHQPRDCLLNRLFRRRSMKISKLRVTGLCVVNSQGTGEFPAQMASNGENVSIWWRHHVSIDSEEITVLFLRWWITHWLCQKHHEGFYSHDVMRQPCLYFRWREIVFTGIRSHFKLGNPFVQLGKIQCPSCDIYVKNAHFDWFNW